jgi:hypothetical protein
VEHSNISAVALLRYFPIWLARKYQENAKKIPFRVCVHGYDALTIASCSIAALMYHTLI